MLKVKKWRVTVKNEFQPRSKIKARYFANIRFYVKLSRILIKCAPRRRVRCEMHLLNLVSFFQSAASVIIVEYNNVYIIVAVSSQMCF